MENTTSTINLTDKKLDDLIHSPSIYHGVQFSSLKGISSKVEIARKALRDGRGVTLYGCCGSGKTVLATCLAREWAKGNIKIIKCGDEIVGINNMPFFTQPLDLLDSIKASWSDGGLTEAELMEFYSNKGLLVLDDLGVGNWSDWAKGMIYKIINHRYNKELPTIITTNLSLGKLASTIDPRISSRLYGMGEVITLGDKDWRV